VVFKLICLSDLSCQMRSDRLLMLQQLNWAVRPAKGDIQVNWRYELPNGVPYGLKCRMLAVCELSVNKYKYKHAWRDGVLFRVGEVCLRTVTRTIQGGNSLTLARNVVMRTVGLLLWQLGYFLVGSCYRLLTVFVSLFLYVFMAHKCPRSLLTARYHNLFVRWWW